MDFEMEIDAAIIAGAEDNEIEDLVLINLLEVEDIQQVDIHFDFNELTNSQCKDFFRFSSDDIRLLVNLLRIPNEIRTANRNKVTGLTALCILLRRLIYPNRLKDLQILFGLSPQSLSHIINYMLDFIMNEWGHLLNDLRNHAWLDIEKMEYYSQVMLCIIVITVKYNKLEMS
uniref:Uncharacterized protein LOC114346516 n=1 Tax=Diabrotica virgifera virgifera TaxID=50390 RepID=A0A6P7H5Q5_DIAVI